MLSLSLPESLQFLSSLFKGRYKKHDVKKTSFNIQMKKLVLWGTDGRLPLSDLDFDLGSGHTAYRRASLIDLYLRTKFH